MARGVEFHVDNGVNIHSNRKEFLTWDELGYTEEEWNAMSEDDQIAEAEEWAANFLDIGFKVVE